MKRYCKNINILDLDFLKICVKDCLKKKWKRRDTRDFVARVAHKSHVEVRAMIMHGDKQPLIDAVAKHMQKQLAARDLRFVPIWYKDKIDASSGKMRHIGIQHVSQQVYDYVAVYAMRDLFKRIGEHQYASIPGRGPNKGVAKVRQWLKGRDAKVVAQLDVQKCFPSIPQDKLLALIDKFVANDNVRWLVHQLVSTSDSGLLIGSYLSQYLCNWYMSFLCHKIKENMFSVRRCKRIPWVKHTLFYMDDILLVGTNVSAVHKAVKAIIKIARDEMGLTIKPTWSVRKLLPGDFVDIMGFRVYCDHTTVRKRVFLRARRAYKRVIGAKRMTLQQAQKCISYYSQLKNADLLRFCRKLKVFKSLRIAKRRVSHESIVRHCAAVCASP